MVFVAGVLVAAAVETIIASAANEQTPVVTAAEAKIAFMFPTVHGARCHLS
jgi:hypothetical protein